MIGGMHHNVGQHILYGAGPRFTLAVFVVDLCGEPCGRNLGEIFAPKFGQFINLRLALVNAEFRPDRQTLRLLPQPLQPQTLGRNNVRQKLQRLRESWSGSAGLDRGQYFAVSPRIIVKLTAQMFEQIQNPSPRGSLKN